MKKTFKKRAFVSAIAMLVVSAIVLTSATFAWFSMARSVSVQQMELNISSPEGVQISANTNAWTTQITKDDLFPQDYTGGYAAYTSRFKAEAVNENHYPSSLSPASTRLAFAANALPTFVSGNVDENGVLTTSLVNEASTCPYLVFDVYLKLGAAQPVYWKNTTVAIKTGDNQESLYAMRAALVYCGSSTTPATAKTVQTTTVNSAQMLEPDANDHLASRGGISGSEVTRYVNVALTENVASSGYVSTNAVQTFASSAAVMATETANRNNMKLNLNAGINRVRVYLWLEGNDKDCLSEVAGSAVLFDLAFSLDA